MWCRGHAGQWTMSTRQWEPSAPARERLRADDQDRSAKSVERGMSIDGCEALLMTVKRFRLAGLFDLISSVREGSQRCHEGDTDGNNQDCAVGGHS